MCVWGGEGRTELAFFPFRKYLGHLHHEPLGAVALLVILTPQGVTGGGGGGGGEGEGHEIGNSV